MEIFLIRHTAVGVPQGTCYGQTDVDLAVDWQTDFSQLKQRLPEQAQQAEVIYSSPLSRCLRLAQFLRTDVHIDHRLQELNFGDWENQHWDDIPAEQMQIWRADYHNTVIPNGESFAQLLNRTGEFFDEMLAGQQQRTVVITHGGAILALLARILSLPTEHVFRLQVDYGSISALTVDGDWIKINYINR